MKTSHLKTPRTLSEGEWETGYYTVEEYDKETAAVTRYAIGLVVVAVVLAVVVHFI